MERDDRHNCSDPAAACSAQPFASSPSCTPPHVPGIFMRLKLRPPALLGSVHGSAQTFCSPRKILEAEILEFLTASLPSRGGREFEPRRPRHSFSTLSQSFQIYAMICRAIRLALACDIDQHEMPPNIRIKLQEVIIAIDRHTRGV